MGLSRKSLGLNPISLIRCFDFEADAKESDKASAIRSKHSVTEQRRRSKINERYVLNTNTVSKFQTLEFATAHHLVNF